MPWLWRQGYLLEQFELAGCPVVFWHGFGSAIERSVMGAFAEQGMKQELRRMKMGAILQARDGRVSHRSTQGTARQTIRARRETGPRSPSWA